MLLPLLLAQTQNPLGGLGGFLPIVLIMGIFYVLLILPQQRRQKQLRQMLSALKSGDKVITSGGIYGTIAGIDDNTVILRIADQVKIRVLRSAIAQIEKEEEAK
jgi:preprotein translocase subunit YajC